MHSVPSRPFAARALLASLTLCASVFAACGGEKPAPTPDPPTVTLTVPQPNTAAPSLAVRVIVSGCDAVSRVDIYDRDTFLKSVDYTSGSMDFELARNEIKYDRGLAVSLSLNARATCSDGRTNSSQPQPATFLPVTKVIKDPDPNGQVVTDFFTAEGSGNTAAFIGCGNTTTGSGTLYRVDSTGVVRNTLEMQIPCSASTVVTELNPTSNKRWVWTPGVGAIAVDSNFVVTGKTAPSYKLQNLSVMSNGDALVSDGPSVSRLQHTAAGGTFQWTYQGLWAPVGPAKQKAEQVLIPIVRVPQESTGLLVELVVVTVDATKTGSIPAVSERTILQFTGAVEHPPLTAFNTDGSVIYISFPFNNNQSRVQACLTAQSGCEGSAHKWDSQFFPVEIQGVFPYAAGSRLAIVGLQRVWFLDSESGLVVNKGGTSVDASGQLQILQVQMGRATTSEFYILAGPASGSSGLPTMPQEIVAVDSAEQGELFRYEVSSSLSCSVDDSGRLWMRLGNNLVQALTLPEYRAVKK